ncbi:MAG: hypothetical protein NT917_03820 [Microcystis aeruginosa WS75]|nr:hypothetical protein [Microcystis aeruginosa WS75]
MPKLPTKSGSETLEVRLKVGLEVRLEVGLEVRLEVGLEVRLEVGLEVGLKVGLEVGLEVRLEVELVGICFPLVSSPIAPKQLSWSKRSLNCFREKLFKSLPLTRSFNNLSILVVDDSAVVIGVVDVMANKLEKGKGIQGSKH